MEGGKGGGGNGKNSAPFDKPFYLIMNVAVGGTNGWFPDGVGGKPWLDGSHGECLVEFFFFSFLRVASFVFALAHVEFRSRVCLVSPELVSFRSFSHSTLTHSLTLTSLSSGDVNVRTCPRRMVQDVALGPKGEGVGG